MHTRVDLFWVSRRTEGENTLLAARIAQLLQDICSTANCFDPKSELSQLNQTAARCPTEVSERLFHLLHYCQQAHQRTLGLFDISFASTPHTPRTLGQVSLDNHQVHFLQEGIRLNLSGMLKGYALEETRRLLTAEDIDRALINMGNSSILATGIPPGKEGWEVTFDPTAWPTAARAERIVLKNECLTTSGNDSPQRYHILHPHDGRYAEGHRGVAVITTDAAEGEVLSTSLFLANEEQQAALCREYQPRRIVALH